MPVAGPARRPDFASNTYAHIREALRQALNINNEQAIARLEEAWDQEQDQPPREADQPAPDGNQVPQPNPGAPDPQPAKQHPEAPEPKGKAKMSKFAKVPPPDSLPPRPSQYALTKLSNFEFIELWYFTDEGCREASRTGFTQANDSFGLTSSNNVLTLRPVTSVKASRNARANHELQWVDFLTGKNNFLHHIQAASWPNDHFAALAKFFFFMETHPMRQNPHGHETIMNYASRIRRQWHDLLKLGDDLAFDIAEINQALMNGIAFEINSVHQAKLARMVSHIPFPFPIFPKLTTFPTSARDHPRWRSHSPVPSISPDALRSNLPCSTPPPPPPLRGAPAAHLTKQTGMRSAGVPPAPNPPLPLGFVANPPASVTPRHPQRTNPHRPALPLPAPVQTPPSAGPRVPNVLDGIHTASTSATTPPSGMDRPHTPVVLPAVPSPTPTGISSAVTGRSPVVALAPTSQRDMNALAVAKLDMVPSNVLARRRDRALTPYNPIAWLRHLTRAGLLHKYPNIHNGLIYGFSAGIPPLTRTFTPPNNPSIDEHHAIFCEIVHKEFHKGRYLGPFSHDEVLNLVGNFQTSPLSLVPKPGKPGKFRLVQNLSFPHSLLPVPSINSQVDSDLFPAPYSTFEIVSLIVATLPTGAEGAVRDVAEAYRTIPLHPSQWHALVVRLNESQFAIDTSACFGFAPSGGIYGNLASAGADIMRAAGIGPILRWVDDHLFIRIPTNSLSEYNAKRHQAALRISTLGGPTTRGGRSWFTGGKLPDGSHEEFDEDCFFPLANLSAASPRPLADHHFTYNLSDIDYLSQELGIPWEPSKDIPFSPTPTFLGLTWDFTQRTVRLEDSKRVKYLRAISDWKSRRTHTLEELQSLHGKLTHAALIFPEGRPYLANLEAMLPIFGDRPFMPRTPPRGTPEDLDWWTARLAIPSPPSPITLTHPILDISAFSDASSSGIGISLGGRWRAWALLPGWNSQGRDIGWAESIGFELLVLAVLASNHAPPHFWATGDNLGVIEGWQRGRSRNRPTNETFKRVHAALSPRHCLAHARYIPSAENPADGLSRGTYPPDPSSFLPFLSLQQSSPSSPPFSDPPRLPLTSPPPPRATRIPTAIDHASQSSLSTLPSPNATTLRPHCLARDRLLLWRPTQSRTSTPPLTPSDTQRVYDVISLAWADSTKITYGTGLLAFHTFCDIKGISEPDRAPASGELLSAFIATLAGSYAGSTLVNYVSAIHAWHTIHGINWTLNATESDALLKAAKRIAPPDSKRPPRAPYTVDIIARIRDHLTLSQPLDAAVFACLTTLFYATARTGEFTVPSLKNYTPTSHITRADFSLEQDRNGLVVATLRIPHTKVSPLGETVSWAKQDGPSDPFCALEHHLTINNPPPSLHLFAYKDKGSFTPLTKSKFLKTLDRSLKAAGAPPLKGHGIRIGSTLEYLLRNVPFEVVKTQGRWASDAFRIYLRKHAQILAPYIQAKPDIHHTFLQYTLPPVRP